ncbi:MAG: hypothetical protein SH819_08910 [Cytophagales bacterium]|nr:hypothetical protein [Cytophagales bacterium]
MTTEEKRVYLLLKAVIFHYHGLDQQEKDDLEETAKRLDGTTELQWAMEFIEKDQVTSFDRARTFLNDIIGDYTREKRTELINMVWAANNLKGYVTEMEATAMLRLASDWNVEKDLIQLVLK